jgi:hypothetical protein
MVYCYYRSFVKYRRHRHLLAGNLCRVTHDSWSVFALSFACNEIEVVSGDLTTHLRVFVDRLQYTIVGLLESHLTS